ncbi:MAG: site-specific DNA-methyltransferase [Verrucomicrobiales bacterium]|nr:site-specific DNA-methyltransferase [Verrucomicrobiales bacterium]
MSDPFDKLAATLSKLFELEKADLDFGIHRIIKARQRHIRVFLGLEEPPAGDPGAPTLKAIVRREMGELNVVELDRQIDATAAKIKTDYGKLAFDAAGVLTAGPARESADGQLLLRLQEERDSGGERSNAQLEAEIYSHLTEFFSRYYDEADFLSKRRIKGGAAPYAVPYSGEEVMLHWANKDQYYIKSSKDLKDYTFTLPDSLGGGRVQFKCERQDPVLNNNNAKREFHLDEEAEIEAGPDRLVIPFHFKIVDRTRTQPETRAWIAHLLERLPVEWQRALIHKPEGAVNDLITRHLANYTRKNEADFFIHKHLGRFLRGELDFYIKNEVMHLDDIDEKSTDYLATRVRLIKALRNIARHLITFLAQLENFQKKLWLKKKYVVETHYCLTLDRVFAMGKEGQALVQTLLDHLDTPIRRYDGQMRSQKDEWVKLYALDEAADWPADGKLTEAFLRAHDKLMLDTVFYPESFKWQLLGAIEDLDGAIDGVLVHSENFQALNLLQERFREKVKCVYIDPPYNTGGDGFAYKDAYQHSTWATMISDRLQIIHGMLEEQGVLYSSIDEGERPHLEFALCGIFGAKNRVEEIIWAQNTTKNQSPTYSTNHEYVQVYAKDISATKSDFTMFREARSHLINA